MTGYKRHLEKKMDHLLQLFPAVGVLGVRQCGKTTLCQSLGPQWHYIDLENERDFEQLKSDPTFFFTQYPYQVIIDEAQRYPPVFNTLRGVIDQHRLQKGGFLITGSSQPELISHITESLAGRIATLSLSPLKTSEFTHRPLSSFFEIFEAPLSKAALSLNWPIHEAAPYHTLWLKGGFPEPLLSPALHGEWMHQFYDTYVYRDIGSLFPRLDKQKFRRFVRLLGDLSGTILNKNSMARSIECTEGTIRDYLEIADGTFVWKILPSYEKSHTKSLVKMPKGYLRDSGMRHYLLNIHTYDQLLAHPQVGASFEGFIIEEILRGVACTTATRTQAYYYRTRGGAEIDLVLEGSFGTLPIEIKHGVTIRNQDLSSLRHFVQENHLEFGIVISQNPKIQWITPEILHIPMGCL
jgi:uncharacterized protein